MYTIVAYVNTFLRARDAGNRTLRELKTLDQGSSDISRPRDICSSYLLAEPVPATTRWLSIVAWRRCCLVPYELELTFPQVILEAGARPGGRPLPGKGRADVAIARIDRLFAKVQLHRGGGVSRVDPVIASRHRLYRERTSSSPRGFLFVAAAANVVVVVAVTFVATRDRAAIIRIEDAYFGLPSARETRALPQQRPMRFLRVKNVFQARRRSFAFVRFSLSLSIYISLPLYLIAHRRPGVVTAEAICALHTTCRLTPYS